MPNKQNPEPGKRYDEETHQWVDDVPPEAPAKAKKPAPAPDTAQEQTS